MHNPYDDIISLTSAAPTWYDQNGVPRYCDHHPSSCPDIYAHEVVLLRIACQGCGTKFNVQMSDSTIKQVADISVADTAKGFDKTRLADAIKNGSIHYGDPPNTDCCGAGATMNCDDLRVLEYWTRPQFGGCAHPTLK